MQQEPAIGEQLRAWRQRRRLSQLDLACQAELSARHLSFVETGRSRPSREMIERLSEALALPLRTRNALLLAGGFAPLFPERPAEVSAGSMVAVQQVLDCQMPFPSLAIDAGWNLVANNGAVPPLLAGVAPALLAPPVNVLRLSLHPEGLAPRIENLAEWKRHLVARVRHQIAQGGEPGLQALLGELIAYPAAASTSPEEAASVSLVATPMRLATPAGTLDLLSTTTVFGTPVEVTLSEVAIETFFPADEVTRRRLLALQEAA